jgi:ribonuclease HI
MITIEKHKEVLNIVLSKHISDDIIKNIIIKEILTIIYGVSTTSVLEKASEEIEKTNTSVIDNLLIYTDGACVGNPGPGGSAMIVVKDDNIIHKFIHKQPKTTNNRMELLAILEALKWLKNNSYGSAIIRSDSLYCLNPLVKGWIYKWERENYKNKHNSDLWKQIFPIYEELKDSIDLEWVKGHSGEKYNTLVDYLAEKAARENE